eukprot:542596-Rhodomonas_salina.2
MKVVVKRIQNDETSRQLNDMATGVTLSETEPEQLFETGDNEITEQIRDLTKKVLEGLSFESWRVASTSVSRNIAETFLQIPVTQNVTILHVVIPVTPLIVTAWKDSKVLIDHTQYGRGNGFLWKETLHPPLLSSSHLFLLIPAASSSPPPSPVHHQRFPSCRKYCGGLLTGGDLAAAQPMSQRGFASQMRWKMVPDLEKSRKSMAVSASLCASPHPMQRHSSLRRCHMCVAQSTRREGERELGGERSKQEK